MTCFDRFFPAVGSMTFYPRGSYSALFNSLNPEFKAMVYTKHVSVARGRILLQTLQM